MKFACLVVIIVSVFLVGSSFSQLSCVVDEPVCVKSGGNCTADGSMCEKGTFCAYVFQNGVQNITCLPQLALGQTCNDDSECLNSYYDNVMCWNGTCQTKTWGQSVGEVCNNLNNCKNEYYCNNTGGLHHQGVCFKGVGQGQNCSYDSLCDTGLSCNAGVCVKLYSLAEGAACDANVDYLDASTVCGANLFCKVNETTGDSVCAKSFASSNAPCQIKFTCDNTLETCSCNTAGALVCQAPTTLTAAQITAITNFQNCVVSSNCNAEDPVKCCNKYQCANTFVSVSKSEYNKFATVAQTCGFTDPLKSCESVLGRFSTAEKAGIIAGGIAIILVVVGLIVFFVKRKKNTYSRIN